MVHTDHDLRHSGRDFDLKQLLEPGAAGHDGGLFDLGLDPFQPQHHVARHWWGRVDGRGDQANHRAKAKQQQQRCQIGKGRHGLHDVQHRLHENLHSWYFIRKDTNGTAHDQRHGHGYSDEGQRIHALGPIARGQHETEAKEPQRRHRQAPQIPAQCGHQPDQDRPGCVPQHIVRGIHRIGHQVGKQPHRRFDAVQEPVQKRPNPLCCGQFPRFRPCDQPRGAALQRQTQRANDQRDQRGLRACGQTGLLRGDIRRSGHVSSTCSAAARSEG